MDSVTAKNVGSSAIYYVWKKIPKQKHFEKSYIDKQERFFCHHAKNVIKPGEVINFIFSFKSGVTGIFTETWELDLLPKNLKPLPPIRLKGHAITSDPNTEFRDELDIQLQTYHLLNGITEIVDDILEGVKTPPRPPPDLTDPVVCQRIFEDRNKELNLFYNPMVMKWWWKLHHDIEELLKDEIGKQEWDLNVLTLKKRIKEL